MVIFQVKVVNYHLVDFSFQIFDICRLTKIDILDLPFLPILIKTNLKPGAQKKNRKIFLWNVCIILSKILERFYRSIYSKMFNLALEISFFFSSQNIFFDFELNFMWDLSF